MSQAPKRRIRRNLAVTLDPESCARIDKLVESGRRVNFSRVVDECIFGYLHVIEADCGKEFVQSDRGKRGLAFSFLQFLKALTNPELVGESVALAYDRNFIKEQLKKINESLEEPEPEPTEPKITKQISKQSKNKSTKNKKR